MSNPAYKTRDDSRGESLVDYWPLVSLILVAAAIAWALAMPALKLMPWMHYFMGIFLSIFALLKLFHPANFADGFQMYDIIAKRFRPYAYVYPLLELGLGLAYLAFWQPLFIYGATVVLMIISTIGVVSALRKGLDINCPCMGSVLDVPLSTVTLTEDIGMGMMALVMLFMQVG